MKVTFKALFLSSMIVIPIACGNSNNSSSLSPTPGKVSLLEPSAEFKSYWFNGQAEISSYKLTQARYGELREGKAVMVFVTEPFSLSKWVKLDQPESNPEDKVDVLKLNFTRNFETGIYPYSLLTSVFSPINGRKAMKINNSCQEWCGHTFAQLKLVNDQYDWLLHSYFETENEESYSIQNSISEDDIWTKIRINPELLPLENSK
jgi:hypothetical protein